MRGQTTASQSSNFSVYSLLGLEVIFHVKTNIQLKVKCNYIFLKYSQIDRVQCARH